MKRIELVEFGTQKITQDTKLAVDLLINRARNFGWVIDLCDTPIGTDLAPTGRELCFEMKHIDGFNTNTQDQINALWGLAIPLGFTPYNRYPLNDSLSFMFHYFGCWQPLMDRILAEGRGNHLWSSLVCACSVDIGLWKGDKTLPRLIQAQLHRVGFNCGVIDGVIGSRTLKCIQSLNLQGQELIDIANTLLSMERRDQPVSDKTTKGFISLPKRQFQVTAYGRVHTVKSNNGVAIESSGGGRLIIDIGEIL